MSELSRGKEGMSTKAPLLQVGREEFVECFKLGESVLQGAAVMVELIRPNGSVAGHICSSFVGAFSIKRTHISGFSE